MSISCRRRVSALALAAGAAVASSLSLVSSARAQVATMGKGYQYFVNNGVQIWNFATPSRGSAQYKWNVSF